MQVVAVALVSLGLLAAAPAGAQRPGATPASPTLTITRGAARPSRAAPAESFTGSARVDALFEDRAPARANGARVTFASGARTHWHTHPLGQTLIVTAGVGRVQQWGGPVEEIRPGDVVWTPPGVKHWHGASPDAEMSHIAVTERLDGRTAAFLEPVTDGQYRAPVRARESATAPTRPPRPAGDSARPSVTPRAMNEFAPQLADLTNRVLYGEVWPDPGLSQRDRSLVTVSALIAMNRPDQLRSHLGRARANGVTRAEVAALITHLAFYAGWPSAVSAVNVAHDVFQNP